MVRDEYQMYKSESRELFQVLFTKQKNTNTFAFCLVSLIFHGQSQNNVENPQRSLVSSKRSQDFNEKGYHISGQILGLQGDYACIFKADFNDISKIGFIYDQAGPEIKGNRRSREAMHKARSFRKSDLNSDHKISDNIRIKTSADEVSTSALRKFGEIFDLCDVEERFNSDPKKCLLKTEKGQRCGRLIPGRHEDMIREVLATLVNLCFEDDEQECILQLKRLVDLAVCKRNHWEKARAIVNNVVHNHGASIAKSIMDKTGLPKTEALAWGSSIAETGYNPSRTSSEKQDLIPDDTRKEIKDSPSGMTRYDFRPRPTTLKQRISYLPNFLPYKTSAAAKSSATEWLKKQISKPLLPSELASGCLYVYWNRANFGFLKIGYTTQSVNQRIKKWISQCKHEAELHHHPDTKVPHVRRLEQIVHAEFKDFRYYERDCPGCHRSHKEWFQLPSNQIHKTVIEKWIQWMLTEPYEEIQGVWQLKSQHAENLDELSNVLRMQETQEVNQAPKIANQKIPKTRAFHRGKNGRLRPKSKLRPISRV